MTQGATANALLGVREIPGHLIRGFKRGIGCLLYTSAEGAAQSAEKTARNNATVAELAELLAQVSE